MASGHPFCPPVALTPHTLAKEIAALRRLRDALLIEPATGSVLVAVNQAHTEAPFDKPVWLPARALASLCAARIAGLEAAIDPDGEAAVEAGGAPSDTERRS